MRSLDDIAAGRFLGPCLLCHSMPTEPSLREIGRHPCAGDRIAHTKSSPPLFSRPASKRIGTVRMRRSAIGTQTPQRSGFRSVVQPEVPATRMPRAHRSRCTAQGCLPRLLRSDPRVRCEAMRVLDWSSSAQVRPLTHAAREATASIRPRRRRCGAAVWLLRGWSSIQSSYSRSSKQSKDSRQSVKGRVSPELCALCELPL